MDFVERLRAALKIPTWWPRGALPGNTEAEAPLLRFQEFLEESYPAFHKAARRHVLSPYSVLYHWPGSQETKAGGADEAVLFLAHYDVVPVEAEKWSVDPFGAERRDGFIWGRGSLDMKSMLVSIMEAAEELCVSGFRPKRDVWFAFGGDEERTGVYGAMEAAKWFASRGARFSWIIDEGTPVAEDQIKGIDTPLALVSIEEKGFLSVELSAAQESGHASMPPRNQAAAVLARALCRIAKNPFPFRLTKTAESFFKGASVFMPGVKGLFMRRARLLGPIFFAAASASPAVNSLLRTTAAMTQLEGSVADNILPSAARAVINLRLLEPWTVESALAFIKKTINDNRVSVGVYGLATDPVPAKAGYESSGWPEIKAAAAEAWPGIPVLPFIMVATTDSRHFEKLCGGIFRFNPYRLTPKDLAGVHGRDERISEENLFRGLKFYTKLLERL